MRKDKLMFGSGAHYGMYKRGQSAPTKAISEKKLRKLLEESGAEIELTLKIMKHAGTAVLIGDTKYTIKKPSKKKK